MFIINNKYFLQIPRPTPSDRSSCIAHTLVIDLVVDHVLCCCCRVNCSSAHLRCFKLLFFCLRSHSPSAV